MSITIKAVNSEVSGRLTFVVPTKNSERTIVACLESIRNQVDANIELIVVDNHSSDATFQLASMLADTTATFGPERSAQRNRGLALATGEFVGFIDSDMVLEPQVASQAIQKLQSIPTVGSIVVRERAFGQGMWAPARVLEKELYIGDSSVEAARIFRSSEAREIGGFDENLIAREDWDFADRYELSGWDVAPIEAKLWHDEGDISIRETFAKKRYYGRGAAAYGHEAPVSSNRTGVIGRLPLLAKAVSRQPVVGSQLVALKTAEFVGYTIGQRTGR